MSTPSNPLPTLDKDNPTTEQITAYNTAYLASRPPAVLALYAGEYGIPGTPLSASDRLTKAFQLAGAGLKVDMLTDGLTGGEDDNPAMVAINRVRSNYTVFGYIGEGTPDWAMDPPGQTLPGLSPYNPAGHTGVVSLTAPPPYVAPAPPPVHAGSLIGPDTGTTTDELSIPGPSLKMYEPSHPMMLPQAFPYTDTTAGSPTFGKSFLFLIMGNPLQDLRNRATFWIEQPS